MSKNSSAKYYRENKAYKKKLVRVITAFLKKKIKKKQQYGYEWYKNVPKDEKHNLVEYRKNYYKMRKNTLL